MKKRKRSFVIQLVAVILSAFFLAGVNIRAWAQTGCEITADTMREVRAHLLAPPDREALADSLQKLKYVTTEGCPSDGDAWYLRAKVEERLGQNATFSLSQARKHNSVLQKNAFDPFSNSATPNAATAPLKNNDVTAPKIEIFSPAITREQVVKVKLCNITLKGRVTDDSQIRDVAVNGAPATLNQQNEFSTSLTLRSGDNRIIVSATDAYGNTARENYGFVCETASPPPTIAGGSSSPPSFTAGKQYALVIGINEYQKLPKLQTAVRDAKEVARVLKEEFGFEVKLLLDADATRERIIEALENYRQLLQNDDKLLIYYAGHGFNDKEVSKAYWQPVNATRTSASSWISADDITTNLRGIKQAQQILVVSDSCYSGEMARSSNVALPTRSYTPVERTQFLEKTAKEKSRILIASGGNEPVADGGGGDHSIFAAKFLLGLREMNLKAFTANELFNAYISVAVGGNSDQLPKQGPLLSAGHVDGDFIFARRK